MSFLYHLRTFRYVVPLSPQNSRLYHKIIVTGRNNQQSTKFIFFNKITIQLQIKKLSNLCNRMYIWNFFIYFFIFTGAWAAIKAVFPDADIKGCAFHWEQAVMRKVANLGLKTSYNEKKGVHFFVRKLLALPYLPADHIRPAFNNISQTTSIQLQLLINYLTNTWLNNTTWSVQQWSVFRQTVRTNNDVEGNFFYFIYLYSDIYTYIYILI